MITMRLAVPAISNAGMDAGLHDGFTGCKFAIVVNVDNDRIKMDFEAVPVDEGIDTGRLVFTLKGKGVEAVIVRSLTERERQMIAGTGMQVHVGAVGTVWDAVRSYIDGRLEDRSDLNPCEGHCHG